MAINERITLRTKAIDRKLQSMGWTRADLAREIGAARQSLQVSLDGDGGTTLERALKIAYVLGMRLTVVARINKTTIQEIQEAASKLEKP